MSEDNKRRWTLEEAMNNPEAFVEEAIHALYADSPLLPYLSPEQEARVVQILQEDERYQAYRIIYDKSPPDSEVSHKAYQLILAYRREVWFHVAKGGDKKPEDTDHQSAQGGRNDHSV